VAHLEDAGDRGHRQAPAVGGADRCVTLAAQPLGGALQIRLALGVGLGEGEELSLGLGCLALGASDLRIVRPILANGLA
jgi:hypothetical protein